MSNINSVIITGNTTKDSEARSTSTGNMSLSFSMAVNEYRKGGDEVSYIDCVLFGNRAASIAQGGGIPRGTRLAIRGHLHQSRWADKTTGASRSKLEIYVDELEFLSAKGAQAGAQSPTAAPTRQAIPTDAVRDEDIPF